METLKYITNALTQFFKSLNIKTIANTEDQANFKLTNAKFGINLKSVPGKTPTSLLSHMYSEENDTLFI